jgi:hypothetical protein
MNLRYASNVLGACSLLLGLNARAKTTARNTPTTHRVTVSWWNGSRGTKVERPSIAATLQQDKTRQLKAMIRQENEGKEVNTTKEKRNPTTTMEGLYENAFRETWVSFRLRVRHTACPNDGRPVTPHWAKHRLSCLRQLSANRARHMF